jgi:hypothetical protein
MMPGITGVHVHRIADEKERPRRWPRKAPGEPTFKRKSPVPHLAYAELLEEYRLLVAELMTCCMSAQRYEAAKAVIERGDAQLARK